MSVEALREQFVGKTVKLRSGGPMMTVDAVIKTGAGLMLDCCWYEVPASIILERAPFLPASVELTDGKRPPPETI